MAQNNGNYVEKIPKQRGRCTSCICMSWKVFTCIFSHVMLITMVIAYCLMGSYAFEWLEADNERQVRKTIPTNCIRSIALSLLTVYFLNLDEKWNHIYSRQFVTTSMDLHTRFVLFGASRMDKSYVRTIAQIWNKYTWDNEKWRLGWCWKSWSITMDAHGCFILLHHCHHNDRYVTKTTRNTYDFSVQRTFYWFLIVFWCINPVLNIP